MAIKVSQYPTQATTTADADLFDISKKISSGPDVYDSQKISAASLRSALDTSTEAITAHAGGGQGSATVLNSKFNFIDTCASDNDSIKILPTLNFIFIQNNTNKIIAFFPDSGKNFYGLSANVAISIQPFSSQYVSRASSGTLRFW